MNHILSGVKKQKNYYKNGQVSIIFAILNLEINDKIRGEIKKCLNGLN